MLATLIKLQYTFDSKVLLILNGSMLTFQWCVQTKREAFLLQYDCIQNQYKDANSHKFALGNWKRGKYMPTEAEFFNFSK